MIVSIVTFLNFNITFHYVSNTFQSGYYAKMCLFFPNFWTSNKPIENRSCQNKKCGMLQHNMTLTEKNPAQHYFHQLGPTGPSWS